MIKLNDEAYLKTFLLQGQKPLILMLPGGAYLNINKKDDAAQRFNELGYHVLVLHYTTTGRNIIEKALSDVLDAIKHLEDVNYSHLYLLGFSAGSHLALLTSIKHPQYFEKVILSYPAIDFNVYQKIYGAQNLNAKSMLLGENKDYLDLVKLMHENLPPMFIWHTFEDSKVDVSNALNIAHKLNEFKVPFELHVFEKGDHSLSSARKDTSLSAYLWTDIVDHWLKSG